jgi:hypothetical protein
MRSLLRILFFFVFLFSTSAVQASDSVRGSSTHPLIPLTTEDHLISCEDYLDYDLEFHNALSCSSTNALPELNHTPIEKPECYIIKEESPDVRSGALFNSVSTGLIFRDHIVGFYEDTSKILYIVENTDAPMILRHELQHYFLDIVKGNADARHVHKIWFTCEEGYYTPSEEATKKGENKIKMKYNSILKNIIFFKAAPQEDQNLCQKKNRHSCSSSVVRSIKSK